MFTLAKQIIGGRTMKSQAIFPILIIFTFLLFPANKSYAQEFQDQKTLEELLDNIVNKKNIA